MAVSRRTQSILSSLLALLSVHCELTGEPAPTVEEASTHGAGAQDAAGDGFASQYDDAGSDAGSAMPAAMLDASVTHAAPDAGTVSAVGDTGSGAPLDASNARGDAGSASDSALGVADGAASPELCPDGFARGDASLALTRIAAFTPSPEGVTVCPDGEVFVTVDGPDEIRRVPLDGGTPELYANLTGIQPAGIACDQRGRLFVAGFGRRDGSPSPPILMVTKAGAVAVPLPAPAGVEVGGLNGIAVVKDVGVFASDTAGGVLLHARELPDGGFETRVVASDLLGANGLAYEASTHKLHLVTSFLPPRVLSFQVSPDGTLTGPKEEASGDLLTFYDGVAVDGASTLYVADYLSGAVLRARDRSVVAKLPDPASFAFRGGTLFVTSYHLNDTQAEGGLYALSLGVCGAAADR